MIDLKDIETPEKIPTIPLPQDHLKSNDELEKIRKELHHIGTALDALIKVVGRVKR